MISSRQARCAPKARVQEGLLPSSVRYYSNRGVRRAKIENNVDRAHRTKSFNAKNVIRIGKGGTTCISWAFDGQKTRSLVLSFPQCETSPPLLQSPYNYDICYEKYEAGESQVTQLTHC